MRHFLWLVLLCTITNLGSAQYIPISTFSAMDSIHQWSGDTMFYHKTASEWQLNGLAKSDTVKVRNNCFTYHSSDKISWSFSLFSIFKPSSFNQVRIHLSNQYSLRIGENGSDDVLRLYKNEQLITSGTVNLSEPLAHSFKIDLSSDSLKIYTQKNTLELQIDLEAAIDVNLSDVYFQLWIKHSASNANKFSFSNLEIITYQRDPNQPLKFELSEWNEKDLKLLFSVPILLSSCYLEIDQKVYSSSFSSIDSFSRNIFFPNLQSEYSDTTLFISIKNMESEAGKLIDSISILWYFPPASPSFFGEIVLSEIFPDPTPSMGLPEVEYIEIYNNSTYTIDLEGLMLSDGKDTCYLPSTYLKANEYLVLVDKKDTSLFTEPVLGISNFIQLNNTEDSIFLNSSNQIKIDQVYYHKSMHSSDKISGGWSLERRSSNSFCDWSNWGSSISPLGGTPNKENSIQSEENTSPFEFTIQSVESNSILFTINSSFRELVSASIDAYSSQLSRTESNYLLQIDSLFTTSSNYIVRLELQDCSLNLIEEIIPFEFLKSPTINSVQINEILYDPESGGVDFIELYNSSNTSINLKGVCISNATKKTCFPDRFEFEPNTYLAISSDTSLLSTYHPQSIHLFELNTLPNFPNGDGTASISYQDILLDSMIYSDQFHHPLLPTTEGVSLERIYHDISSLSSTNWHSAAENHSYATPGYQNSSEQLDQDSIVLSSQLITPNGDGDHDLIRINFHMSSIEQSVEAAIYDSQGRRIKLLLEHSYLDSKGSILWDGTNDNSTLVNQGYYIIRVLVQQKNGKSIILKKPLIVLHN